MSRRDRQQREAYPRRPDPWQRDVRVDRAGRYRVIAPAAVVRSLGEMFVRGGIQFRGGEGRTPDFKRALAMEEQGYQVIDTESPGMADAGSDSHGGTR